MSKLEALKNYLEIDNNEHEIERDGNYFYTDNEEYCILTEDEVYELGEERIRENLKYTLYEEIPKYLHGYFDENKYVDDHIERSFDYVDYGYGFDEIKDNDENIYYYFKM